ncbi:MAG: glycosyltransferase family 9 protein [Rhizomicrobium sp.]
MSPIVRDWLKQAAIALTWVFFFSWFDWLTVLGARKRSAGTILLVKMDAIGDFALGSPILDSLLREAQRDGRACALVCDKRSVVLANALFPDLDTIGVDTDRFASAPLYRRGVLRDVAARGPSATINLGLAHELLWSDSIVRVCGAAVREGLRGYDTRLATWLTRLSLRWYTRVAPMRDPRAFVGDALRDAMATMGHDVAEMHAPTIRLDAKAVGKVPQGSYFALAPGSLRAIKRWPAEHFAEIAKRLHQRTGWRGVMLGAPEDGDAARQIARIVGDIVVDFVGRTSLVEAIAIVRGSRLLVANDSALAHIAALSGVPCVATLGGGHPGLFLPYPASATWLTPVTAVMHKMPCYYCEWRCIYPIGNSAPAPCVANIDVEDFWSAVMGAAKLA